MEPADIAHLLTRRFDGLPQRGDLVGHPEAPAVLTNWCDLQCPDCRDFSAGPQAELLDREVRTGSLALRYLPLATASGQVPEEFALQQGAALAAGLQNRLWEYVEAFHLLQETPRSGYVTPTFLVTVAGHVPGLDLARWESERHRDWTAELAHGAAEAARFGIHNTPRLVLTQGGRDLLLDGEDVGTIRAALQAD